MAQFKSQAQLVSSLRDQLSTNSSQALKALVVLFNRQTEDEKVDEHTRYFNEVGFNHNDAKFLTSVAKQYLNSGHLSTSQIEWVMKLVPKYAGQLVRNSISSGKIRKENGYYVW
jgi:hypothetical protein